MTKLTQSYYCGASQSQIIYETIGNYFDGTCAANPEVEALVVRHQNVRWSYQQLQEQVNSLAAGLLALGVQVGDRVGIWGPNSAEWVMVQLAIKNGSPLSFTRRRFSIVLSAICPSG